MRFLICGGRDFGNDNDEWWFIHETLNRLITYDKYDYIVMMHGAARGVDSIAGEWAEFVGIPCVEFPAEWDKYGKSAGYRRNRQMLEEGKPDWVIAFPGGRGTEMMVDLAKKAKVKVHVIDYPYSDHTLSEDGLEGMD